jgi:uncharacterized protein (DUF433 family)
MGGKCGGVEHKVYRTNKIRIFGMVIKKYHMNLLNRITIDPEICHGKPCVRGMRWPIEVVIDMLGSGMDIGAILSDHPELEKADILACLQYPSFRSPEITFKK